MKDLIKKDHQSYLKEMITLAKKDKKILQALATALHDNNDELLKHQDYFAVNNTPRIFVLATWTVLSIAAVFWAFISYLNDKFNITESDRIDNKEAAMAITKT